MSLRNLFVAISVGVTGQSKLDQTAGAMDRLVERAEGLGKVLKNLAAVLAVGALINGIENFVEQNVKAADALYNQAAKLGMTTDELQKYEYASQQMGITTQETAVAIRFFNRAIGEAQLGTKSAVKTFSQLGLLKEAQDPLTTTSDLLLKFSDRLEKIPSQGQRTAFVMRTLGRGGSAMLPILQQGSKKLKQIFEDLDEMGGGFDQKFAQDSHDLEVALKKQRLGWRSVSVAIIKEVMPTMQKWVEKGTETVKLLIYLSKHTYGFRTALMFAAASIAALATAFVVALSIMYTSLAPIIAAVGVFVGIITALYIAFDDFYTFLEGGDSVLGDFLNRLGGTGAAKKFRDDLVAAFDDVKQAFGFMTNSSDDFHKSLLRTFVEILPYIIKWGVLITTSVVSKIDNAVAGMRELIVVSERLFGSLTSEQATKQLLAIDDGMRARAMAYKKLSDLVDTIGEPKAKPHDDSGDKEPGQGTGTREMVNDKGGINLPAPPAPGAPSGDMSGLNLPPPPAHVHVQVTNHISAGANGGPPQVTTKVKVNGETQNRNTHSSILEGMPSTAD
jgi:hypothetical protein